MKRKTDPGIKILTFVVPACAPNIPSRPRALNLPGAVYCSVPVA